MSVRKTKIGSNLNKGIDFLNSFVASFNKEIGGDVTFVGNSNEDFSKVQTISLVNKIEHEENFEYETKFTPCKNVLQSSVCVFSENVQELFPSCDILIDRNIEAYVGYPLFSLDGKKVIGIMVTLFKNKLDFVEEIVSKFKLLAPRVEMELDRYLLSNELADVEATYKTVVNQISEGVTISDMEGSYISVNSAFCRMSGYSEAELLTKTVFDMKAAYQPHKSFFDSKDKLEGLPIRVNLERKDGTEYLTEIIGDVITLGTKDVVLGTIRDITDKVNSEKKIESLNKNLELTVAERTEELNKTIKLKELLFKEVTHRVKNNLQVICSILNLQKGTLKNDESIKLLTDTVSRIHAMSLIHETLYKSNEIGKVWIATYIESLLEYITKTMDASEIEITMDVEDIVLSMDIASSCGMLLIELLTNSLKYAFPKVNGPKIHIAMSIDSKNNCNLIVKDNGVGFPKVNLMQTETIGMQLIFSLSDQLDGKVSMTNDNGANFQLNFPI